jgi:hypothetical protein
MTENRLTNNLNKKNACAKPLGRYASAGDSAVDNKDINCSRKIIREYDDE